MTAMVWWMTVRARAQRWLDRTVNASCDYWPAPEAGTASVSEIMSTPSVHVRPVRRPYDWQRDEPLIPGLAEELAAAAQRLQDRRR